MDAYAGESPVIMSEAVTEYMIDGNKFFPKIADLAPYVKKVNEPDFFTELLFKSKQTGNTDRVDNFILQWELERGSIVMEESNE